MRSCTKLNHCLSNRVRGEHLCVGCGLCVLVCPHDALSIKYNPEKQYQPVLNQQRCVECGLCFQYCPVQNSKLILIANDLSMCTDSLSYGLEQADCYVGYDQDTSGRQNSASGGVLTALLKSLLSNNEIDAIIHAEGLEAKSGEPHFSVCVSRSAEECDQRRGSFYGPLCYLDAIKAFRGQSARLAVTGVPCVIRGFKKFFEEHPDYKNNSVTLIALACSHNVTGQFVDMLAQAKNIPDAQPYQVNLRDKTNIPDANQYNTCFFSNDGIISRQNRFSGDYTKLWRSYCFSFPACHYCPDFWGVDAELSVKDAWGKWATDPLGKSIIVARSPRMVKLLESHPTLSLEPLDRETAKRCQRSTCEYKLRGVNDRMTRHWLASPNRRSRFSSYYIHSRLSRTVYRWLGFRAAKVAIALIDKIMKEAHPRPDVPLSTKAQRKLRRALNAAIPGPASSPVIVFGTGKMAGHIAQVLKKRILYFVDNNSKKTNTLFCGKPVHHPSSLIEDLGGAIVVIASSYHLEIASQLDGYQFAENEDYISAHQIYRDAVKTRCTPKKLPKILVLGGYGFKNAGDEAQLSANLTKLHNLFPDYMIKVLTPNPTYTYKEHQGCAVEYAPRVAFFDYGQTELYALDSQIKKIRFLMRALWLLSNAILMRIGLPPLCLLARRVSLLQEIATSRLVFFSGGGYLTGSTLSRLWDGMFFIQYARILRTPVVLSGQTIGVWNSSFSKHLANICLSHADVISTRDANESIKALTELNLNPERFMPTYDDALFCNKETNYDRISNILSGSGVPTVDNKFRYIALNIHFWGVDDCDDRALIVNKLANMCRVIQAATNCPVLGIPMVPSDTIAISQLASSHPDLNLFPLSYPFDFRLIRTIIAGAELCVTMKHHPIIFAVGEGVVPISLAKGKYYEHKNLGALDLFGLNEMNVALDAVDCVYQFERVLLQAWDNRAQLIESIDIRIKALKDAQQLFDSKLRDILSF